MHRSSFAASCLAAYLLNSAPAMAKTFVYVSAAEDGVIDRYEMDRSSGVLTPLGETKAGKLVMPTALSPTHPMLYAVVRSLPTHVVTYAIDPATGDLKEFASAPLPDSMPYVSTDRTGRFLFTASYGGDKVAVNPIDPDGAVRSASIQVLPTGKNAHSIMPDRTNRFVYAANLGSDQVLQYRLDVATGSLTPNDPPLVKTQPNNGPRHPAFSPDGRYVYYLCELTGMVLQFAIDPDKGTLTALDSVATVPADSGLVAGAAREAMASTATSGANTVAAGDDGRPKIWAADIALTPDGRFVYTTERTKSHLAQLSVASSTGRLTYARNYPTEEQPRGIRIDPTGSYLVATGEKSDRVSTYRIDKATGDLTLVGRTPVGRDANWVEIVDLP